MELLSEIEGRNMSLNCTLSRHCEMSDIQAAFSWMVGANKFTAT